MMQCKKHCLMEEIDKLEIKKRVSKSAAPTLGPSKTRQKVRLKPDSMDGIEEEFVPTTKEK